MLRICVILAWKKKKTEAKVEENEIVKIRKSKSRAAQREFAH